MHEWAPGPGWLFCPADRPGRFEKAFAVADVTILDLEDAVAPDRKAFARHCLHDSAPYDLDHTVVRVNPIGTRDHDDDLQALQRLTGGRPRIMVAKSESADAIASLAPFEVIALIETPLGVLRAEQLANVDNVVACMWGAEDLVAGLGGSSSRRGDGSYSDVARHAQVSSLVATKAANRLAIDAVFMDLADVDRLRLETEEGASMGFDAKAAIHPNQVQVIRNAYTATSEQVAWADSVLEASLEFGGGVFVHEGRMVDGPVLRQAQQIARSAAISSPGRGQTHTEP